MRIRIGRNIEIDNPTPDVLEYARRELILANPEYAKKKSMGKWLGGTPQSFFLYELSGDTMTLPVGCAGAIWGLHPVRYDWSTRYAPGTPMSIGEPVGLYDYQEEALRAGMAKSRGVIIMPCGSGKTQVGLALAARRGTSTLWLTHTHDLLKQSMDRAASMFGLARSDIGTITGGRVDISKTITFATVQTIVGIDLARHADAWGTIIVDECHHAIGAPTRMMMFYKVLSALNAQFRYGLTATPDRADGLEAAMYALIGPAIINISRDRVAHNTVPVSVQFVETAYAPDITQIIGDDGVFDNAKAQRMLSEDEPRNAFVAGVVESLAESGKTVLVLTGLVAHAHTLAGMYGGYVLAGRVAKKQRDAALADIRSGDVRVLYATHQLAKEGLDIPRLDALVWAMPVWDETTVIQSAGRVARRFEGKLEGVVYDLVDDFELYRRKARKRGKMYESAGHSVAWPR